MASRADMELESTHGGRFLAALAVSLLCHVLVLLVAPGWRRSAPPAPLLVTMIERGGGEGDGAGGQPAPAAPPQSEAPARAPVVAKAAPLAQVHSAMAKQRVAPPPVAPVVAAPVAPATAAIVTDDAGIGGAAAATTRAGEGASGERGSGGGTGGGRGTRDGRGDDGLRAFCARCPAPEYPSRARRQGWQGTVDVALAIGGDGSVAAASVARSSGYAALDDVALAVARESRFAVPAGGPSLHGQLRYRFVLDTATTRR